MIQIWMIDSNGFYQNESKFVDTVTANMTTVPLTVGYVKPKLVNGAWQEGATEQEIAAWQAQQIDISNTPTEQEQIDALNETILDLADLVTSLL